QYSVELRRSQHRSHGELYTERSEKFGEAVEFFERGLIMHAVDESLIARFQHFGRRHIGEDHIFLDEAMRVKPRWDDDGFHSAHLIEDYFAFRKIEVKRAARFPRAF